MSIFKRFRDILSYYNLNPNSLGNRLGLSQSTIRNITTEKSKPGFEVMEALVKEFPEIDANWLISGEGPMLKRGVSDVDPVAYGNITYRELLQEKDERIKELKELVRLLKGE